MKRLPEITKALHINLKFIYISATSSVLINSKMQFSFTYTVIIHEIDYNNVLLFRIFN